MKVLVLGPYSSESGFTNGVIVHVTNLVRELSRHDLDLHLITLGDTNGFFREGNLKVHMVKRVIKNKDTPLDVLRIRKKIGEVGPDIIHAHSTWYPYSTALLATGKRYVRLVTIHGNMKREADYWKKSIKRYVPVLLGSINEFAVLRSIDNVIIVSPVLKKDLGLRNRRIFFIPNGFNFDEQSLMQAACSEKKRSDLLFVGSLSPIKGCDVLIKAVAAVKDRYPGIKAFVAGTGPSEPDYRAMTKSLGLDDNIKFIGYVQGAEKFSYIRSTRICVIPSRSDMAPSTLFEAMAAKKPVVASNIAGIPHIVDDGATGLLFEAGNEADLAEKIITLLGDDAGAAELGANGEKKLKQEYDWKNVAREIRAVYESLRCLPG